MGSQNDSQTWCSDALHDLIGYSDSSLASYLTATASKSKSYHSILRILEEGGVQPVAVASSGDASAKSAILTRFAKELHARCKSSQHTFIGGGSNKSSIGNASGGRLTHADMMRRAATYELLEDEDETHNAYKNIPPAKTSQKSVQQSAKSSSRSSKEKESSSKSDSNKIKERKKNTRRRRSYSTDSESSDSGSAHIQSNHSRRSRYDDSDNVNDDRKSSSHLTAEERTEIDREKDLKERDEFVKRMQSRDRKRTKQKSKDSNNKNRYDSENDSASSSSSYSSARKHSSKKKEAGAKSSKEHNDRNEETDRTIIDEKTGTSFSIEQIRKESRRAYLKKREEKELSLLEQSLRDEEELFGKDLAQLTKAERKRIELSRQILAMARQRKADGDFDNDEGDDIANSNRDGFYRLPDDYEQDQKTRAEQNSKLLSSRYIEEKVEKSEQELWEESQKSRVNFGFGGKKKRKRQQGQDEEHPEDKKYDYVFEDQIDFVMQDTTKGYDNREHQKRKSDFLDKFKGIKQSDSPEKKKQEMVLSAREKMLEGRKKLPVYPYREEFLAAVKDNQVLILVGETGSGKTTQIPQYLHEVGYSELGKIGCTQPRRVAAMSVAARVSTEMGCKLGHQVGYSIRFENCTNKDTVIQYMTDGMLLREFLTEPDLKSYSCLVIDEAHERTLHTDILFGLVKDIVRFRDDLRLIISSATLDAEKFSRYFDDASIFMIPVSCCSEPLQFEPMNSI